MMTINKQIMHMLDFLKNYWFLVVVAVSVVGGYNILQYRIDQIEPRVDKIETIQATQSTVLAEIQKDIFYIRESLTRIEKR